MVQSVRFVLESPPVSRIRCKYCCAKVGAILWKLLKNRYFFSSTSKGFIKTPGRMAVRRFLVVVLLILLYCEVRVSMMFSQEKNSRIVEGI